MTDKLSTAEGRRLRAMEFAMQYNLSRTQTADEIVQTAKKFEAFLKGEANARKR